MENVPVAVAKLQQLRDLDVRLQVDDFGTGYSSLSYLGRFPFNALKIDRSFVSGVSGGEKAEILRAIILLARQLGMEVIAEGVETKEQLELLRSMQCDLVQGYYFSRPLDQAAAEKLLSDGTSW